MTYSILILVYRKPGTTPEHFQEHYEKHVLLIKEITREHFPLTHLRRYIPRAKGNAEGTERNIDYPATVPLGAQSDFDYDALAELTFTDIGAFQTFFSIVKHPDNATRLAEDEEKWLDRSKMPVVVLGEKLITTNDTQAATTVPE